MPGPETVASKIGASSYSVDSIMEMYDQKPVTLENTGDDAEDSAGAADDAGAASEHDSDTTGEVDDNSEGSGASLEGAGEKADEETSEKEPTEEAKKPEKAPKIFKTKIGDEDVEIPGDAEFEIKVDGKITKAKFSDITKYYQSGVSVEKKYEDFKRETDTERTKLKTDREHLDTEKSSMQQVFQSVFDFGKDRDPAKLISKIVEYSQADPAEFEVQFLDSMVPLIERWQALTQEQKNVLVLQRKNTVTSAKLSKIEAAKKQDAELHGIVRKIEQLCEGENISGKEFEANFKELNQLKEGGHLQIATIEPQTVVNFIKIKRLQTEKVYPALEKVDPSLKENGEIVSFLTTQLRDNPKMTEADLDEIVQGAYGKGKKAKVEDRLNKKLNNSDTAGVKKGSQQTSTTRVERVAGNSGLIDKPWTFNDY